MNKRILRSLCALVLAALMLGMAPVRAEEGGEHPLIRISIRDYGDIYAELYPEYAPITVANFLRLIGENFYDGLTFHRIISGFMIQGGDPLGNGTGGSEEKIKGEFSQNGVENPLSHSRGVLSMARSSQMDSASSQFFIMHADSTHLDGAYAAFGRVIAGMAAVDKICLATPVQDNNGTVARENQPVIDSIRVATAAEAEAAKAAEQENGLAGTVFHDPLTGISFQVPPGWNRLGSDASGTVFQAAEDEDRILALISMDVWARYGAQLTGMGYAREQIDTEAAIQIGLIRLNTTQFSAETHNGIVFYTAEATNDSGTQIIYVGAHNGNLCEFIFSGNMNDPHFADVAAILDSVTSE